MADQEHNGNMKTNRTHYLKGICLYLTAAVIQLPACTVRQSYYVSPFNSHHSAYHPIRLQSDSLKSAYHMSMAVGSGSANVNQEDEVFLFYSSVSGSHNFRPLQAYYSLNLSAGKYYVAPFEAIAGGKYSFGGAGFEGGMNAVIPFRGGEWRMIGIEASLRKEFGRYLSFRKDLPGSAADLIIRDPFFGTLGGYTELVLKGKNTSYGLRASRGAALGDAYHELQIFDEEENEWLRYRYSNFTLHLTLKRFTGSLQFNFATKATGSCFGLSYRLNK